MLKSAQLKPSYKNRLLAAPISGKTLFGPLINRVIEDVAKDPQPVEVSIKNQKQSGSSEAKKSRSTTGRSFKQFKKPEPARHGSKRHNRDSKKSSASAKKTST